MLPMRWIRCLLLISLAAGSCARPSSPGVNSADQSAGPFGPTGIPPQLRASTSTPSASTSAVPQAELTPEEDIVFTDPDDPDANLPELSSVLASTPKRREAWEKSESIAKRRAAREGKPLLIWFTDSARSPMCKSLSQELFSRPDFDQWADEKLVRLRVDANVTADGAELSLDQKDSRMIEVRNYVVRLKKQYKALGHPTVVMLNPLGEVVGRYRGYKRGDAEYFWGQLKQGEAASTAGWQTARAALEKKGYRDWHDRRGRSVFAKLTSYNKGSLTLIEPDGTRSRTDEDQLSDADREWLAAQKQLRAIR